VASTWRFNAIPPLAAFAPAAFAPAAFAPAAFARLVK
jgi:hypothetical protein